MTTLSLADARANLSKIVDSAIKTHERFSVTRNGNRVAVIMSADDHDALLDTIDILSNTAEVQLVYEGLQNLSDSALYTSAQVQTALAARKE